MEPCMLPDDVLVDILLRLPVRAVGRLRAVSKAWRAAASKPAFLRAYTLRAASSPVILSWSATERAGATDFHLRAARDPAAAAGDGGDRLWDLRVTLPGHCTSAPATSWDGILCVELDNASARTAAPPPFEERVPSAYALVNPLSGACAVVPAPAPRYEEPRRPFGRGYVAGGYAHPVTGIFHLLHCTMSHQDDGADDEHTLRFQILRVDGSASSAWREIPVSVDVSSSTLLWLSVGRGRCISSATVNGRLHWWWPVLGDDGQKKNKELLVFDAAEEAFGTMPLPELGAVARQQAITTLAGKLCLLAGFSLSMVEVWELEDYRRGQWQLRQRFHLRFRWFLQSPLHFDFPSSYLGNVGLILTTGGRVEKMVFHDWGRIVYDARGGKLLSVSMFGSGEGLAIHRESLAPQDAVFGAAPRAQDIALWMSSFTTDSNKNTP